MTVEELVNELLASCQSLEDDVFIYGDGRVTLVSGEPATETVWLNYYDENQTTQTHKDD